MNRIYLAGILCFFGSTSLAQTAVMQEIEKINPPATALAPLHFLAADELMGRGTHRPEIKVAAKFISDEFRKAGLKEFEGLKSYYQHFDIKFITAPQNGTLTINSNEYQLEKDFFQIRGTATSLNAAAVFAGFGSIKDFDKTEVKDRIVITRCGENDSTSLRRSMYLMRAKQKLLKEKGAVALIEVYKGDAKSWEGAADHFMHDRSFQAADSLLPVFYVRDTTNVLSSIANATSMIEVNGNNIKNVEAENVIGYVEGTDPKLKDQYIVLSAHYDHIGIASKPKMEEGKLDSIFNGARDNAVGTAAVIAAARYFAKHPAKRSILFIGYTAEEIGLLGSMHFADHPPLPLNKLVYNLNIDNASYNDTTIITIIGLGRTSADKDIRKAVRTYGMTESPDLNPQQNLFDRSDNVSLARKGIPAPTYSLGVRKFDETITNRYHQLSDEVRDFNLSYAVKFINSYVLAVSNIANNKKQPKWIKGDKYEGEWKKLFGR